MKNKMKQDISPDIISEIFKKHFLDNIANTTSLDGGEFNSVYKVVTKDGKKYVIKIAPDIETKVLTHEQDLIKSEVFTYKALSDVKSVHFPKIYGYNWTDKYPYRYLIMEFIDGQMLSNMILSDEEYDNVMFDLGRAMAEIHMIKSKDGFGYIQNGLKKTWKETYNSLIENIINDGLQKKANIPYLDKIKNIIHNNEAVLDSVKSPSLVHFDLWAGNIIIKENKLYALIDCERAMFGDVMGDFISLDYASPFDTAKNKKLIEGYNSIAQEKISFNKEDLTRLYLMKIYLGLIVCVESYYRLSKLNPAFYDRKKFAEKILETAINEITLLNSKK